MRGLLWGICLGLAASMTAVPATAQQTFKIDVTRGVEEPLPIAVPGFTANGTEADQIAADMRQVMINDLVGTALFREIPREAHISEITRFDATPAFADWKAINAEAMIQGDVAVDSDGTLTVSFRLWDTFAETPLGEGLRFQASKGSWRRIAHKLADTAYSRITGEGGYFDSRVVFVSESGAKGDRKKRLALMDQDGANMRYLTGDDALVLAPRFSPTGQDVLYTSYESGRPQVYFLNVDTGRREGLGSLGSMSFAPRFSPDGKSVVLSATENGNTDLYRVDLSTRERQRLTNTTAIETAPSFSPDGSRIVFESDRGGTQQLYVMPAAGGDAKRISFGEGRYGTPVWSPRGDMIAFTKIQGGRFHIGVMRIDGSRERLLTASFLDEGPTWAPNGRVLMFFRESRGENGAPQLFSVDVSGKNLRQMPTPGFASDPSWSKLLP